MSPLLNTADAVRKGSSVVRYVYKGSTLVWPIQISGLVLWLDSLNMPIGAFTSNWVAGPGTSYVGTYTGTLPSCLDNVLNGHRCVYLNAGNGILTTAPIDRDFTIAYVSRMWGSTKRRGLTSGANNVLAGYWSGTQDRIHSNGAWGAPDPQPAENGAWKMYSLDGNTSAFRLFRDGTLISTIGSPSQGFGNQVSLGSHQGSLGETSDIAVAELVGFNRKLTDAERQQVEMYLKRKWAV